MEVWYNQSECATAQNLWIEIKKNRTALVYTAMDICYVTTKPKVLRGFYLTWAVIITPSEQCLGRGVQVVSRQTSVGTGGIRSVILLIGRFGLSVPHATA